MHAMSVKLYALQAIRAQCVALLSRERCKSPAQLVTERSTWTLEFDHSVDDTEDGPAHRREQNRIAHIAVDELDLWCLDPEKKQQQDLGPHQPYQHESSLY